MDEKVKFWQHPEVCLCLRITNFPLFVKVPSTVPAKDMYVLKWIRSETHFVVKISVPRETQYLYVNVSQKEKTTFSFEVFHIFHEQRLPPPPIYVLALSHCTKNTCRFLTKLSPFTMLIFKRYGRKISTFLEKELVLLVDRSLSRDNGTLAELPAS